MTPIKLFMSLLLLCIFLVLIGNPDVWSHAGYPLPDMEKMKENYRVNYADSEIPKPEIGFCFIFRLSCFICRIHTYKIIVGGFVASVVFFIYRIIMYKDTSVEKLRRDLRAPPALKKWKNVPIKILPQYLLQYLFILLQCILWAVLFVLGLLFDVLPDGFFMKTLVLGFAIAIVNTVPIYLKMWIESTYPNKLLAKNFAKGIIGNFIIAFALTYIIWYDPFPHELTFCNCLWPKGGVPLWAKAVKLCELCP